MNKEPRRRLDVAVALSANPEKVGWRISEWAAAVGLCRATVYNLLGDGKLCSVKSGSARIITTSPSEYLSRLSGGAQLALTETTRPDLTAKLRGGHALSSRGPRRRHSSADRGDE